MKKRKKKKRKQKKKKKISSNHLLNKKSVVHHFLFIKNVKSRNLNKCMLNYIIAEINMYRYRIFFDLA